METTDFLDVKSFHKQFFLPVDGNDLPHLMEQDVFDFRMRFLSEELSEIHEAYLEHDLVAFIDGLVDFNYIVFGTALFMGVGEDPLPMVKWPSIKSVNSWAEQVDILKFRPEFPDFPHEAVINMTLGRIESELHLFSSIHKSNHVHAVKLATSCLWNAAHATYLCALMSNLPWTPVWAEVQMANLAKRRAEADASNSTRKSRWDVVKPVGWTAPDKNIATILVREGAIVSAQAMARAEKVSVPKA